MGQAEFQALVAESAERVAAEGPWWVRESAVVDAGPQGVCWEFQAGEDPIRLSFNILVF